MLRGLVVLLLAANLGFFAWSAGWLDTVLGIRAGGEREPERLLRQVRPETVRIVRSPGRAALGDATPSCLEAGPFSDAELAAAQAAAQDALPAGSWITVKTEKPATWIVYMGRFASAEALTRKEDEIKRRRLPYEEVREPPSLAPGLSLGRYDERGAAERALEQFTQLGVRTARVAELVPAASRHLLRVDKAGSALAARLVALPSAAFGKGFGACGTAAPGG